jgi:hypothetical protein
MDLVEKRIGLLREARRVNLRFRFRHEYISLRVLMNFIF